MSFLKKLSNPFKKIKKTQKQVAHWMKLVEAIRPVVAFEDLPHPMAPDYSHLPNWAAHPDLDDKSNYSPEEIIPTDEEPQADVFFIHPTTFLGKQSWNAPLEHQLSRAFVDEVIMPSQASVFNESCRIFAPRYRQATFYSFLEGGKNAEKALELACSDLIRAFDYYLENENNGRPFFLAGHSQGALHCIRLLEQRIENTRHFQQFVAAYAIGFRFPEDKFGTTLLNIQKGIRPDQTGCVLAWDTYIEGGKPARKLENRMHWYPTVDGEGRWEKCANKNPFGVNPLSWEITNETVQADHNKGAVHSKFAGKMPDLGNVWENEPEKIECIGLSPRYKHEVSATLKKDGFLYVSKPFNRVFRTFLLPRGNYHLYDIALFYMNIRENTKTRLAAFLAQK